jgi:hypothetical protein
MKLLSFSLQQKQSWGAVVGGGVIDLGKALPQFPTLADFIASADFAKRDRYQIIRDRLSAGDPTS